MVSIPFLALDYLKHCPSPIAPPSSFLSLLHFFFKLLCFYFSFSFFFHSFLSLHHPSSIHPPYPSIAPIYIVCYLTPFATYCAHVPLPSIDLPSTPLTHALPHTPIWLRLHTPTWLRLHLTPWHTSWPPPTPCHEPLLPPPPQRPLPPTTVQITNKSPRNSAPTSATSATNPSFASSTKPDTFAPIPAKSPTPATSPTVTSASHAPMNSPAT